MQSTRSQTGLGFSFADLRKPIARVVIAVSCLGISATASAQFDPNLPDFYTRPIVSPYLDMLNPNLGPDFMRYNRNIRRDLDVRQGITQNRYDYFQQQRQIQEQSQQFKLDRQRDGAGGRGTGGQSGRHVEPRRFNPFFRPSHNPLTGASNNIRATGHSVSFGGGRR